MERWANLLRAVLLGLAILAAAVLHGGVYQLTITGRGGEAYRVNRLTGEMKYCLVDRCRSTTGW